MHPPNVALLLALARARDPALSALLLLVADVAIVGAIKLLVQRPRPEEHRRRNDMRWTVSADRFAFPSGHASRAALVAATAVLWWVNAGATGATGARGTGMDKGMGDDMGLGDGMGLGDDLEGKGTASASSIAASIAAFLAFLTTWTSSIMGFLQSGGVDGRVVSAVVVWAVAVSVSRVLMGRHYVSDVVGGWLLGLAEAFVLLPVLPDVLAAFLALITWDNIAFWVFGGNLPRGAALAGTCATCG